MNKSTILNFVISGFLVLSIGLITGYTVGFSEAKTFSFPQFKPVPELNPGITTIEFLKQENGILYGQVEGQKARIAYSPEHIDDLEVGHTFEIPLNQITLNAYYGPQDIPEGMAYISSKTGKYYYGIMDPRALRITPKNRLYFQSATEAENAGFSAPK